MDNNQNKNNGKKPENRNIGVLTIILLITVVIVSMMNSELKKRQTEQVGYKEFVEMVEAGDVEEVRYSGNRIYIIPKTSSTQYSRLISYYTVAVLDLHLTNRLLACDV